jgi:predicted DsbA family dithiol-disulfide isomerase
MSGNIIALRCSFDLVCPYSYILAHEVEEAEDEGLVEVEWLPFELRPALAALPSRAASASVTTGATTSTGSLRTTGSRSTFPPTSPAPRSPGR